MELETILNTLIYYKLTFDEYMLVYLTLLARDEENHPEHLAKWLQGGGLSNLRNLVESLKEKGIINKTYTSNMYSPNDVEFNKTFVKGFYKHSGFIGEELFKEYPPFLFINGTYASIKNIGKKFYSLQEFYFYYAKTIGHCPKKHEEVMALLKWGKENNHINYGILEFVASCKWNDLRELKEQGLNNIATTYDIYTE